MRISVSNCGRRAEDVDRSAAAIFAAAGGAAHDARRGGGAGRRARAERARSASSPTSARSGRDDLEGAARSSDFRERAVAFRAIGQFRWRAKEELLRRGLDDESPACRGSALLSLELLSRDHPSTVNGVRPLLHTLATADGNAAVRRLAILCLKNGSPEREHDRPARGARRRRRGGRASCAAPRATSRSS